MAGWRDGGSSQSSPAPRLSSLKMCDFFWAVITEGEQTVCVCVCVCVFFLLQEVASMGDSVTKKKKKKKGMAGGIQD